MVDPVIFLCTEQLEAVAESAVHRGGFRTIDQGANPCPRCLPFTLPSFLP